MMRALFCLTLGLLAGVAQAVEIRHWQRLPLGVPLAVGHERVIFLDQPVRVGLPPALSGKLRVQSANGALDLLASTPWQLDLQDALSCARPIYGHLPVLVEADGSKLSKSRHSIALDPSQVAKGLTTTLTHLSQLPPPELAFSAPRDVWKWALEHWNPQALAGNSLVRCPHTAT